MVSRVLQRLFDLGWSRSSGSVRRAQQPGGAWTAALRVLGRGAHARSHRGSFTPMPRTHYCLSRSTLSTARVGWRHTGECGALAGRAALYGLVKYVLMYASKTSADCL